MSLSLNFKSQNNQLNSLVRRTAAIFDALSRLDTIGSDVDEKITARIKNNNLLLKNIFFFYNIFFLGRSVDEHSPEAGFVGAFAREIRITFRRCLSTAYVRAVVVAVDYPVNVALLYSGRHEEALQHFSSL